MKISHETLTLLKNFAGINGNIFVREGNTLATVSPGKNILARAAVPDTFTREFAIYDLNSLLALLTLMEDQEVEFNESSIRIQAGVRDFEYFYSDPSVVTAAPDKELEVDPFWDFTLTAEDISMINRAASITDSQILNLVSDGSKVILKVTDPAKASSNSYRQELASGDSYPTFDVRLKVENLKVLADTYEVSLGRKKAIRFKSTSRDLVYFIAMDPSSTV